MADSELVGYYERLLETLKSDIDVMLQEPDPTKRAPKIVLSYLEMAAKCEAVIGELGGLNDDSAWWDKLSAEARTKILEIIKIDRQETDK